MNWVVKYNFGNFLEHKVFPFVKDLFSTNGTFLDGEKIRPNRFYQVKSNSILKLAKSNKEYVFVDS